MGYYIETPVLHGKAAWLAENYDAELLDCAPASFADVPDEQALVMVVDNGIFEAAGYVFSKDEFGQVVDTDPRPRQYLLMDKITVELLSGYGRAGGFPDYRVYDPESVKAAVAARKA